MVDTISKPIHDPLVTEWATWIYIDCQEQDHIECVVHIYLVEIPSLMN